MTGEVAIKITSVRHRGPRGGAIVAGQILGRKDRRVVVIRNSLLPDSGIIHKGQVWLFEGTEHRNAIRPTPGVELVEQTINARTAVMERPSGDNLIDFIAANEDIRGIGTVKATRLYEHFGQQLAKHIENRRIDLLAKIVPEQAAELICDAFEKAQSLDAIRLLDRFGIDAKMGRKVLDHFGARTPEAITENPYVLIAFYGKWKAMDAFALTQCGIAKDSELRLCAALEDALYDCFSTGSTLIRADTLRARITKRLGDPALADTALDLPSATGQFYCSEAGYHPAGPWLMERQVAQFVLGTNEAAGEQLGLGLDEPAQIDAIILAYEADTGFVLTPEQRLAVSTSANSRFSLICGGAGVGKTTVLNCLIRVIEASDPFAEIHLVALAGKAAMRMTEATGRDAKTIASFLRKTSYRDQAQNTTNWLLIDEGSMVDLIALYRMVRHVPANTRVVMLGDPFQLPPVGPGLTLHALMQSAVPSTTLTQVHRQAARTGIPQVAATIRAGRWPQIKTLDANEAVPAEDGVFAIPCAPERLNEITARAYQQLTAGRPGHDVKVLCPTRSGIGGVSPINAELQAAFRSDEACLVHADPEHGPIRFTRPDGSTLRRGDLVLFTRNDYERDLRNGSLGTIEELHVPADSEGAVCSVDFDGNSVDLTSADLDHLELGYAITVHKSQGSQFRRVIVPLRRSRLLDRSLLYTAVTRSVSQIVIVGDMLAAESAVSTASASRRSVGLPHLLALE